MPKHLSQKIITVMFVIIFGLSACQTATPDPVTTEQTMQAAVALTLTAAPTLTPIPTATSTATPTASPTPVAVVYGPTNFPANINPLTGLEVEDPTILDRLPVMIKVANQAAARPHAGLTNADIVFDYYVGSGLDRFVALYYGKNDTKVGSVRSGRMVDRFLVRMYNGILAMVSADKRVLDPILSTLGGRVILNEHCDDTYQAICRLGERTDESSVFADTAQMSAYYTKRNAADNVRKNLDGMAFATIPPPGGVLANEFIMRFGKNINHQWKYDAATKKYLHWIDEVDSNGNSRMIPLVDRNNDEQLATSNVITIFVKLNTLNGAADSIHEYEIQSAKGRALIFRDGMIYDVFYETGWDTPIQFYDAEGNPFPLQPGNTWIHLTGMYSKVIEEPAGIWKVNLGLP
jgi:hypothetical protein